MSELDDVGRSLMDFVRDGVLADMNHILAGTAKAPELQDLSAAAIANPDQDMLQTLVRQSVDDTIHHLLWWLEQPDCPVRLMTRDGRDLAEISDGLPGELYSDRGWIARFSKAVA